MKIAEIVCNGIQKQYVLLTPFKKPVFIGAVLYDTIEHLAHEHGHGILEDIAADSHQRVKGCEITGSEQG